MPPCPTRCVRRLLVMLLVLSPGLGRADWCSVSVGGVTTTLVDRDVDVAMSVTLNCQRAERYEGALLSYRIKATLGGNAQSASPYRRVRLGASGHHLAYALTRATSSGGSASCSNTTNWTAPSIGNSDVMTGTINFANRFMASVTWNACLRVRAPASQQPWPAAGSYQDSFSLFVQYPGNDSGALSPSVAVPVTVNVTSRCALSQPSALTFNYPSFSRSDVMAGNQADLRCSNGLPWSATLDQNSGRLLGLDYTLSVLGPSMAPSGSGTGLAQRLEVLGRMPAGQSGTCNTGTCTARRTHTLTITY